jgi:hypothetical protein
MTKTDAAAQTLSSINPDVKLESYTMNITTVDGFERFKQSLLGPDGTSRVDLVLSCVDNYEARITINQVRVQRTRRTPILDLSTISTSRGESRLSSGPLHPGGPGAVPDMDGERGERGRGQRPHPAAGARGHCVLPVRAAARGRVGCVEGVESVGAWIECGRLSGCGDTACFQCVPPLVVASGVWRVWRVWGRGLIQSMWKVERVWGTRCAPSACRTLEENRGVELFPEEEVGRQAACI